MKTSIQFYCSIIVFFAMVLVSCSKDGDIGPIGPAGAMGEQGITGPAGPAGENGEALGLPGPQGEQGPSGADGQDGVNGDDGVDGVDGEDGNANVLVKTVDLVNYDWLWSASLRFEGLGWFTRYADINVPQINAEIDHNGLVLMYLKADPAGGWQTFPFQFTSSTREYETRIIYKSSVGNIRLHYWWAPVGGDIPSSAQLAAYTIPDLSVKYVIIEGNLVSKTPGSSIKKLKNMTYEQVMDHFGLNH